MRLLASSSLLQGSRSGSGSSRQPGGLITLSGAMCLTGGSRCRLTWLCFAADEAWKQDGGGGFRWAYGKRRVAWNPPPSAHWSRSHPQRSTWQGQIRQEMKSRATLSFASRNLKASAAQSASLICPTAEELFVLKEPLSREAVSLFFSVLWPAVI